MDVYDILRNNAITCSEFESLELTATGFDSKELTAYKGVMLSKTHAERDMFKINLLNMINKD